MYILKYKKKKVDPFFFTINRFVTKKANTLNATNKTRHIIYIITLHKNSDNQQHLTEYFDRKQRLKLISEPIH